MDHAIEHSRLHSGYPPTGLPYRIDECRDHWRKIAPFPKIVCLCGSTRFFKTFVEASLRETLAGSIVLSIGAATGSDDDHFGQMPREEYERVKEGLDALHFRKIELADEVLILNVENYIGHSTTRELAHAIACGKHVRFWTQEQGEVAD